MSPRKYTKKNNQSSNTKSKRKKSANNNNDNRSFIKDEIIILLSLAVCALLMISHFGVGGYIGNAVSAFLFGIFGIIAYIVPILLFVGIAFVRSNRGNAAAYIKAISVFVATLMLSLIFHLILNGDGTTEKITVIYKLCSTEKTAGGIVGALLAKLMCPAIGVIGTYLISCVLIIICFVIITGKSFVGGVKKSSAKAYNTAKEDVKKRKEQAVIRKEQRIQEQEAKEYRKDKVVSGVSFDTTLPKKSPEMREITLDEVPALPQQSVDELFEQDYSQPAFEDLVINRAMPIMDNVQIEEPAEEHFAEEELISRKRRSTKERSKKTKRKKRYNNICIYSFNCCGCWICSY